jgi:hypothetical protein
MVLAAQFFVNINQYSIKLRYEWHNKIMHQKNHYDKKKASLDHIRNINQTDNSNKNGLLYANGFEG